MSDKKNNIVTKHYTCPICNSTHKIKLSKDILNGREKFPFPYVIIHNFVKNNEFKEVLTILYLDKDLQIRSSEIQELKDDNLFSKAQVVGMTQSLMEENRRLREDVERLTKKLNQRKSK
jgi:hypothetical protein